MPNMDVDTRPMQDARPASPRRVERVREGILWGLSLLLGLYLLASLLLPAARALFVKLEVATTQNLPARGRRTQVEADLRNILTVANTVYTETGRWPESIEEMVDARSPDGKLLSASLEKFPRDPWDNEYRYEVINNAARVRCLGSDRIEGGENEAEDIVRPERITR